MLIFNRNLTSDINFVEKSKKSGVYCEAALTTIHILGSVEKEAKRLRRSKFLNLSQNRLENDIYWKASLLQIW